MPKKRRAAVGNKELLRTSDLILRYIGLSKPWLIAIMVYILALYSALILYSGMENYLYIWIILAAAIVFLLAGFSSDKAKSRRTAHVFYLLSIYALTVGFFLGDNAGNFNLSWLRPPVPENLTMMTFGFCLMVWGRMLAGKARRGAAVAEEYVPVLDFFGAIFFLLFLGGLITEGSLVCEVAAIMVAIALIFASLIAKSRSYWAAGVIYAIVGLANLVMTILPAETFLSYLALVLGIFGVYKSKHLFEDIRK